MECPFSRRKKLLALETQNPETAKGKAEPK